MLDAIEKLPDAYRPKTNGASSKPQNGAMKSPVRFADVWVGVSCSYIVYYPSCWDGDVTGFSLTRSRFRDATPRWTSHE